MNCPSCGLLNLSTADICVYCKNPLGEFLKGEETKNKVVDLSKAKSTAAASKGPMFLSDSSPQSQNSDWRAQLNLKLDRLKEKDGSPPSEATKNLLQEIRDREFARPSREDSQGAQNELFVQSPRNYHPLAQRTLEKLNRVSQPLKISIPPPASVEAPEPLRLEDPSVGSSVQTRKVRKDPASKSERIERIEINLSQQALPFDEAENPHTGVWEEGIKRGLTAAALSSRIRAGAIDGLFICGCFLIFLMIVFFVPNFDFLSRFSFAGLTAVAVIIANGYLFLLIALSGRTLGMDHEHLRVISFDGEFPSLQETSLRSFGYFISLGCFCLGFLWAVFDPQRLTWHDRISKTLIATKESQV